MKVGIISDTHDDVEAMEKALKILKDKKVDMIIHCGDWIKPSMVDDFNHILEEMNIPGEAVLGNNDKDLKKEIASGKHFGSRTNYPKNGVLTMEIGDRNIAVYHGENKTILRKLYNSRIFDAIFYGHTHVPKKEQENGTLLVNPGSASPKIAKSKHIYSTIAIYDSDKNEAELMDTVP